MNLSDKIHVLNRRSRTGPFMRPPEDVATGSRMVDFTLPIILTAQLMFLLLLLGLEEGTQKKSGREENAELEHLRLGKGGEASTSSGKGSRIWDPTSSIRSWTGPKKIPWYSGITRACITQCRGPACHLYEHPLTKKPPVVILAIIALFLAVVLRSQVCDPT